MLKKVNLSEKLDQISDHWNPRIVAELNGQHVKLAKVKGEFVMHRHDQEDELFYVLDGALFIELTDHTIELHPGEFVIIPKGTDHKPYALEETSILLFEPASTLNTGNITNDLTRQELEKL